MFQIWDSNFCKFKKYFIAWLFCILFNNDIQIFLKRNINFIWWQHFMSISLGPRVSYRYGILWDIKYELNNSNSPQSFIDLKPGFQNWFRGHIYFIEKSSICRTQICDLMDLLINWLESRLNRPRKEKLLKKLKNCFYLLARLL